MQLPADVRASALAHVALFCENRVPDEVGDEIRLGHAVRGNAITIFECRPPWREGIGADWTRSKIAQLRYDPRAGGWSLHWADHKGRWLPYDRVGPAKDVGPLLAEIGSDPYGAFWG